MKIRVLYILLIFIGVASCNVIYQTRIQANIYEQTDVAGTEGRNIKHNQLKTLIDKFTDENGFSCKEENDALYDLDCFNQENYIRIMINFGKDAVFISMVKQHASALSKPKHYTQIENDLEELLINNYGDSHIIVIE